MRSAERPTNTAKNIASQPDLSSPATWAPMKVPSTAPAPIHTAISQRTAPRRWCARTLEAEVKRMVVNEVAIAICTMRSAPKCSRVNIKVRNGTRSMPPPMPSRPAMNPVKEPSTISSSRNGQGIWFGGSVRGGPGGRAPERAMRCLPEPCRPLIPEPCWDRWARSPHFGSVCARHCAPMRDLPSPRQSASVQEMPDRRGQADTGDCRGDSASVLAAPRGLKATDRRCRVRHQVFAASGAAAPAGPPQGFPRARGPMHERQLQPGAWHAQD